MPLKHLPGLALLSAVKQNRLVLMALHQMGHAKGGRVAGQELFSACLGTLHGKPRFSARTFLAQASLQHRIRTDELPAGKALLADLSLEVGVEL